MEEVIVVEVADVQTNIALPGVAGLIGLGVANAVVVAGQVAVTGVVTAMPLDDRQVKVDVNPVSVVGETATVVFGCVAGHVIVLVAVIDVEHVEVTVAPVKLVDGKPLLQATDERLGNIDVAGGWINCAFRPDVDRSIIQSEG